MVNIFNFLNFIYFFSNLYYLLFFVKYGFSLSFFNSLKYRFRMFICDLSGFFIYIYCYSFPLRTTFAAFYKLWDVVFLFLFLKYLLIYFLQFIFLMHWLLRRVGFFCNFHVFINLLVFLLWLTSSFSLYYYSQRIYLV